MSDKLNMAIAGVGRIGMTHIVAMQQCENVNLVAVVEPNEEKGREVAEKFHCDYYKDIADLKDRPDIDAVNICVPEEFHVSAALAAAAAGKHIMLEKPIAKTYEDAEKIIQAAKEHNVRLMIAHTCRFMDEYRGMRNVVQSGQIGDVLQFAIRRFGPRSSMEYLKGRVTVLFYIGIHDIDAIQWMVGSKITKVYAQKVDRLGAYGEDGYSMTFTLENGISGTMALGWDYPTESVGGLTGLDIIGSNGVINFDMAQAGFHKFVGKPIPVVTSMAVVDGQLKGAFANQIKHFAQTVLNGGDFYSEAEDVAYSVKVCQAILRSAETGLPVEV